jgi:hypothetical protein
LLLDKRNKNYILELDPPNRETNKSFSLRNSNKRELGAQEKPLRKMIFRVDDST